jgi:hypothetical protein
MSAALPPGKHGAMNGRCGNDACAWVWPVVYLPMPLERAAEVMQAAHCPACGSSKVFVA